MTAMPCRIPRNLEAFEMVIDLSGSTRGNSAQMEHAIGEAKKVCKGCTVRAECFSIHGQDLSLGVIAGLTDAERTPKKKRAA